jgi:hypothetical protein
MLNITPLLITIANTPADTPVVVDIGGNGIDLIPVIGVEFKDGTLIIKASKAGMKDEEHPAPPAKPKTKAQLKKEAKEAVDAPEFE